MNYPKICLFLVFLLCGTCILESCGQNSSSGRSLDYDGTNTYNNTYLEDHIWDYYEQDTNNNNGAEYSQQDNNTYYEDDDSHPSKQQSAESEPVSMENTVTLTLDDDTSYIFYQKNTIYKDDYVEIEFEDYTPRGDLRHTMSITIPNTLGATGDYSIMSRPRNIHTNPSIFLTLNGNEEYHSYNVLSDVDGVQVGTFTVNFVSDDWRTYEGDFSTSIYTGGGKSYIDISGEFNFTLDAVHQMCRN